jgi:hypothetical protein
MNIACVPPTLVLRPSYNTASVIPRSRSSATRASPRACSASSSPNTIDSVGHADAHAGFSPAFCRS